MNDLQRYELLRCLQRENPQPQTELLFSSTFELLIAVMLSAQATDKSVNRATRALFAVANTPETLLALGEEKLQDFIKTIGLYRSKSKHIMATCKLLIEQFQSQVPAERHALESLPGVGRKTANVLLNTAFGQAVIAVDTHIFRVANRTGLAIGKTPLAVEQELMRVVPDEFKHHAHHWLILHGRYVCKARHPLCTVCKIAHVCEYPDKRKQA